MLVFCARKKVPYFPQKLPGEPYRRTIGAKASTNYGAQRARGSVVDRVDGGRCPTTILTYNHDRERWHPTQKPVPLLEFLIRTYTDGPGAVVLDNGALVSAPKPSDQHDGQWEYGGGLCTRWSPVLGDGAGRGDVRHR